MAVIRRKKAVIAGVAVSALAAAALLSGCSTGTAGAKCDKPVEITWLGTIKVEIQDQFTGAIEEYNKTNTDCVTVSIVEAPQDVPFLQTVTPMYEAGKAPTIMTALQELPDMADKVMDWKGQALTDLAAEGTLDVANINGKQVGLPVTAEAFGLIYNEDVLSKAGVDATKVNTVDGLKDAFEKIKASGVDPVHFSGLWWSLGAHFTNIYHTNAADTAEGRLAILDDLKAGKKDLMADPVFKEWLDVFDILKANKIASASIADTDYDTAVENVATGKAGYWFMGNWAEPNLLTTAPDGKFGLAPVPLSNDAAAKGNNSISVGVPFYIMVDKEQASAEQQAAAVKVLTWFLTTEAGQKFWAGPVAEGGMSFIPVYKDFKVQPSTMMAKQIADYIAAGNTLQWVNSAYPAGLQDLYGAAAQKYYDGQIDRAAFAAELQAAWTK
ncbi:MAG TPA: ABC transporter substrate-binding protein [Microbacteriaceae bacterium]|nr:ABC transporter substrate-binding protein [Microbacteriaceae bacterium]